MTDLTIALIGCACVLALAAYLVVCDRVRS